MVFSMTAFCSILAATVLTGGWDSPVRLLFLCCPVMSFLVGGKQEGIYVGALTMLCGLGLFYLNRIGWELFHIHRPENIEAIEFSIWIISMTLLISCVVVYDELLGAGA